MVLQRKVPATPARRSAPAHRNRILRTQNRRPRNPRATARNNHFNQPLLATGPLHPMGGPVVLLPGFATIYTHWFGVSRSNPHEDPSLHEAGPAEGCAAQAERERYLDPRRRLLRSQRA